MACYRVNFFSTFFDCLCFPSVYHMTETNLKPIFMKLIWKSQSGGGKDSSLLGPYTMTSLSTAGTWWRSKLFTIQNNMCVCVFVCCVCTGRHEVSNIIKLLNERLWRKSYSSDIWSNTWTFRKVHKKIRWKFELAPQKEGKDLLDRLCDKWSFT
jgi:hypothetical protein